MNAEQHNEDGYAYEHIRFGNFEREIKGPIDYVERRMNETFEFIIAHRLELEKVVQRESMARLPESNTPSLADDGASESNGNTLKIQSVETTDLCTFYLKKAPKTKADAVKVITFYYEKYAGISPVSYEIFDKAYRELAAIGVDEPGNIRTSVRNAIKSKHLHRVDKAEGQFALTYQGKEYVKEMGDE